MVAWNLMAMLRTIVVIILSFHAVALCQGQDWIPYRDLQRLRDSTTCGLNATISPACFGLPAKSLVVSPCACSCLNGFSGLDCRTCNSDDACLGNGEGQSCDTTLAIRSGVAQKNYDCTLAPSSSIVTGGALKEPAALSCDFSTNDCWAMFTMNDTDVGDTSVICTFQQCTAAENSGTIRCEESRCQCGDAGVPCQRSLGSIMNAQTGHVEFSCDISGQCLLKLNVLLNFEMTCKAGNCLQTTGPAAPLAMVTPAQKETEWVPIGISFAAIVCVVGIASLFVLAFYNWWLPKQEACFLAWMKEREAKMDESLEAGESISLKHLDMLGQSFVALNLSLKLHETAPWLSGLRPFRKPQPRQKRESKRAEIISGVNFSMRQGEMLAVMGPSGSGKSTLMNVLAGIAPGRVSEVTMYGAVMLDGIPRDESYRKVVAYVPKEDLLHSTLTVRESVAYSAKLRLPAFMPASMKEEKVKAIINFCGLASIQHKRINGGIGQKGLSSGERKRVRIAMELVTDPRVLLLDEPTTCLDSHSALRLVELLRLIATEKGTIIVTSIHQPNQQAFELFDQALLLSRRGQPIYYGLRKEMYLHFTELGYPCPLGLSFSDHMMQVVVEATEFNDPRQTAFTLPGILGATLRNCMRSGHRHTASQATLSELLEGPQHYRSRVKEVSTLYWREMTGLVRNPSLLAFHILVAICMGLLMGGIYHKVPNDQVGFQNRAGAIFFCICAFSLTSLTVLETFVRERMIFESEASGRYYRIESYFIAKLSVDWLFLRIIPVFLFSCIMYWMMGLRNDGGNFLLFIFVLSMDSILSGCLCACISLCVDAVSLANIVAIVAMLLQLLFGGFLFQPQVTPMCVGWLRYFSYVFYSFEVLVANDVTGTIMHFDPIGTGISILVDARLFLATFGLKQSHKDRNCIIIATMVVGSALWLFALLVYQVRRSVRINFEQFKAVAEEPRASPIILSSDSMFALRG